MSEDQKKAAEDQTAAKAKAAEAEADAKAKEGDKKDAKADNALHAEIKTALRKLDHSKDADWTEDGLPSLKRVIQIAGNAKITRPDVEAADPAFRREKPKPLVAAGLRKPSVKADYAGREVENQRVKALARGQYGGKLREPGEEFVFTGVLKWWTKPVSGKKAADA